MSAPDPAPERLAARRGAAAPLDRIGFADITEARAAAASERAPLAWCTLVLTEQCNLRCTYCRHRGGPTMELDEALRALEQLATHGLGSLMISGGEPTLHPDLPRVVDACARLGIRRSILATNGTAPAALYRDLLGRGLAELSISLDTGDPLLASSMSGIDAAAHRQVVENIRALAGETRVVVGLVVHDASRQRIVDDLLFIDSLGPADIKLTPSAQMKERGALEMLTKLPAQLLQQYPFLRYRVCRYLEGAWARGLDRDGTHRCFLALDDMAVSRGQHYPCYIYWREGGAPIGPFDDIDQVRRQRHAWVLRTDTHADPICRAMCVDFFHEYNCAVSAYREERAP